MTQEFKPARPVNGLILTPIDPRAYTVAMTEGVQIKRAYQPPRKMKDQSPVNSCMAHVLSIPHERMSGNVMGVAWPYAMCRKTHYGPGMILLEALNGFIEYGVAPFADDQYNYEMPYCRDNYALAHQPRLRKAAQPYMGSQHIHLTAPAQVKAMLKTAVDNPKSGITVMSAIKVRSEERRGG